MTQWDLNSQPTYMDGPYVVSLDRKFNGENTCTLPQWSQTP